ncbi:hypothetical protein ACUXCC_005535 [Cytobacillus horneckiae]|uniref:hypothetical protein n=1 Tax=Cytobacillus horneckiae TaxID=549687 RepID=UPI0019D08997|nr:hypothetical protein [Cytobacillus horneckiae]MBN6890044.1 hypothetical protein [Cytobacillus horneckiae]
MKSGQLLSIVATNGGETNEGAFPVVEKAYEAGYLEVLTDIAMVKLNEMEDENKIVLTDVCRKAQTDLNVMYNDFMKKNEQLRGDFLSYDDQANFWASLNAESYFIQGYIEGYKLAKRAKESGFEK